MLTNMEKFFATLALCIMFARVHSQTPQFANPVLDTWSPDPRVLFLGNFYYLSLVNQERNEIRILKSPILSSFRHAEEKVVYRSPAGYLLTDSIELVSLNNSLLMYFSMTNGTTRQIYVMTARDSQNPQGGWNAPTKLLQNVWTEESFHGTVMQTNQNLYFVWTSYNPSKEESIFIAQMTSPTEVVEPVTLLRQPEETWECYRVRCVNEAPSFVYNRGIAYLVFSASQSSDVSCALSYMSIELSKDPMITSNWFSAACPVFGESDEETVYKACHAGFTTSRDGTETWMVYHATNNASSDALDFSTRIERLFWNKTDGTPIFSSAHGNTYLQPAPSGEPEMFTNPILDNSVTDPTATLVNGQYYLVYSTGGKLTIARNNVLTDFRTAETKIIYESPEAIAIIFGGLYEIQEQLYIHFTMNRTTFVTQAEDALNPLGNWSTPISLLDKIWSETVANQAVLQHNNKLYFVWTHGINQLFIVEMISPTEVTGPVVLLKEATEPWACVGGCLIQAPACIYHDDVSYLVFSVSYPNTLNYSLAYMKIDTGKDPLDVTNWVQSLGTVFGGDDEEQVYSAAHASYTTSSDGKEDWVVYWASRSYTNGTLSPKIAHIERVTWNDVDGAPVFPKAHGSSHPQPVPTSSVYFSNPIAETTVINPGIILIGAFYYLLITESDNRELVILKSGKLTNFREAERKVAYRVPSGYSDIQSPEMHLIDEKLYMYFAMRNSTHNHRLYAIEAELSSDPLANWGSAIRLNDHLWDVESVDGTIMKHNDKHYLAWASPEPTTGHFSLYMAEMDNATSVKAPVAVIREPYESWECSGGCVNNAPNALSYNEKTFLVHSVSSLCSENYALTWISIENGKDPLDSINWVKATGTVFQGNENEGVYCAGHASFTQSPDKNEVWMVYQASASTDTVDGFSARVEKISWNEDGTPKFPIAHGPNSTQLIPSNTHIYF